MKSSQILLNKFYETKPTDSLNNTVCGVFLSKMVCGNLAKFLYNRTELFRFVVQNSTDANREKDGQSICCYYLCFLSSFLNNAVCGVFLCKLVCGNVAELLYSFTELFRFILHNSTDANGKRIQTGDQSPHKMRSMFKNICYYHDLCGISVWSGSLELRWDSTQSYGTISVCRCAAICKKLYRRKIICKR